MITETSELNRDGSQPHPMVTAPRTALTEAAATISDAAANPLAVAVIHHKLGTTLTSEQVNTVCTVIATLEDQNRREVQAADDLRKTLAERGIVTREEAERRAGLPDITSEQQAATPAEIMRDLTGWSPRNDGAQPETPANGTPQVIA